MLILTRKLGESITIGDDIKVSVLGVHGRQVRLGIEAPMNVVVHREEIYVKIQEENRRASKSLKDDLFDMVKVFKGRLKGKGAGQGRSGNLSFKTGTDKKRPGKGDNAR